MRYKEQSDIEIRTFHNSPVDDDYIFRELARKMVSEMPLEALKDLFDCKKIDPLEFKRRPSTTNDQYNQVMELRERGLIRFSIICDLTDKDLCQYQDYE